MPEVWNGTLLIFAHGYRDKADHPGEIDNRNADVAPNAALEAPLLAQGFALAGTAYKDNGWAIGDAISTLRISPSSSARTWPTAKDDHRRRFVGTFVGYKSMEQFDGIYDGALCLCSAGAGATRLWDSGVPLYLAYDVVFGIPPSWGTVGEVRNDIDFDTEVLAKLAPEFSNIANFPKFEFIRLVAKNPGRGITPPPPPAFFPGWALTDFFFITEARAELQRRAGGPIVQNLDQHYDADQCREGVSRRHRTAHARGRCVARANERATQHRSETIRAKLRAQQHRLQRQDPQSDPDHAHDHRSAAGGCE